MKSMNNSVNVIRVFDGDQVPDIIDDVTADMRQPDREILDVCRRHEVVDTHIDEHAWASDQLRRAPVDSGCVLTGT